MIIAHTRRILQNRGKHDSKAYPIQIVERKKQIKVQAQEIVFPNGKIANYILIDRDNFDVSKVINSLNLKPPKGMIVISGGAAGLGKTYTRRLTDIFSRAILPAGYRTSSIFIDGGTNSGVMKILGDCANQLNQDFTLLGIAPYGKVQFPGKIVDQINPDTDWLEPNHTHFILVEGNDWGDETNLMYTFADEYAKIGTFLPERQKTLEQGMRCAPILTILIGGNTQGISKKEIEETIIKEWPLLVISGSGPLADLIAYLHGDVVNGSPKDQRSMDQLFIDKILGYKQVYLFSINDSTKKLRNLLLSILESENNRINDNGDGQIA